MKISSQLPSHISQAAILVFGVLLAFHTTRAAITLTSSGSPPTSNIVISATTQNNSIQWRNLPTGRRDVGQSFLTDSAFTLDSVKMRIAPSGGFGAGAANTDFSFDLYSVPNATTSPAGGTLITSQNGNLPSTLANDAYVTFDIPDVSLTANQQYIFMFSFTSPAANNEFLAYAANTVGSTYSNGTGWLYDETSYSIQTFDTVFYLTPVPEPSSSCLLIFGAVGLLFV